jgi:hypothetical protein
MEYSVSVLVSLLVRGCTAEFNESAVIEEGLFNVADEHVWDVLFDILKDNDIHRFMLERLVDNLGFKMSDFKEYLRETGWTKEYDFTKEYIDFILNEVLKWEKWTFRYYSHIQSMDFEDVVRETGTEIAKEIKETLDTLIKWEAKHIEKLEKLLSSR